MSGDNLIGHRFGRLVVLGSYGKDKKGNKRWMCICDCGKESIVLGYTLKNNSTRSCGCLRKERVSESQKTHGQSRTRLYRIWTGMKTRCNNPNAPAYTDYGGRGIAICPEWQTFLPFYAWAITNGYNNALEIDRIDNDQGYSPDNCRWATRIWQARNKRTSIKYKGKPLKVWCQELNLNYRTIRARIIEGGWQAGEALSTPIKTGSYRTAPRRIKS